jgi:aminopeptidase N
MDKITGNRREYLFILHGQKAGVVFCLFASAFFADVSIARQSYRAEKVNYAESVSHLQQLDTQSSASPWFDVTYYGLRLDLSSSPNFLRGHTTIAGICRSDTSGPLILDLINQMRVDSVLLSGQRTQSIQAASSFSIALGRKYLTGEQLKVDVYYQGVPLPTGFGSFIFTSHLNTPWIYSLSEPCGARDWWPCKNDPGDKADSADIVVTCESSLKVGSNGKLVSVVNNGNGTSTFSWKERYPIASYLISIAVTNYAQFSNWFRYPAKDSMEILNYVLPEHYADALTKLPRTVDMLNVYSGLFGLYPFINEKYGHAEFGGGGAMEHQTMTSTTTFDEDVISHELAHQWFGDMITCRTWSDLWLNEGFAQYCSALYREQQYGKASYWSYMNAQLNSAVQAVGAIGVPDTSSVPALFDGPRIYCKGASVLHMLRHVLGDSVFFLVLTTYADAPSLKYATASIRDFQDVCELVSGKDLSFFFQEWIYGTGFPHYEYTWSSSPSGNGNLVLLDIVQSGASGTPAFFTMPLDVRISATGWDTTVTVVNDSLRQRYWLNVSRVPSNVQLDPDGWILKLVTPGQPPAQYLLSQNYPNPFNPKTTISFQVPTHSLVTLKIFDLLGRELFVLLSEEKWPGSYAVDWNSHNVASGVYFYRLQATPILSGLTQGGSGAGSYTSTKKMIVVR